MPYEDDEVTRVNWDGLNQPGYESMKTMTIGELREWVLDHKTTPDVLKRSGRNFVGEVASAVAKIMTSMDLVYGASKIRYVTHCNTEIGQAGTISYRAQTNSTTDDPEPGRRARVIPDSRSSCRGGFRPPGRFLRTVVRGGTLSGVTHHPGMSRDPGSASDFPTCLTAAPWAFAVSGTLAALEADLGHDVLIAFLTAHGGPGRRNPDPCTDHALRRPGRPGAGLAAPRDRPWPLGCRWDRSPAWRGLPGRS